MKKMKLVIITIILSFFASCNKSKDEVFKVGVTPPDAGLLNNLKEDFKKVGLDVVIVEFTDYKSPNLALAHRDIDANLFQHKPFLDNFKKKYHLNITSVSSVAISPIGLYSKSLKNINEIKDSMTIGLPNDPTNLTRTLLILQDAKLIKLNKSTRGQFTLKDISENNLHLHFFLENASKLPLLLNSLDAAFVNGNYAISNGLDINKDTIYVENKKSPYANVVAVRYGDEDSIRTKKFMKVLKSQKTKDYIKHHYKYVFPTF